MCHKFEGRKRVQRRREGTRFLGEETIPSRSGCTSRTLPGVIWQNYRLTWMCCEVSKLPATGLPDYAAACSWSPTTHWSLIRIAVSNVADFSQHRGVVFLRQLTVVEVRDFRNSWTTLIPLPKGSSYDKETTVKLLVSVACNGQVLETDYLAGPPQLYRFAADNVRQRWYFQTLLNGLPIEIYSTATVVFEPAKPGT